MFIGHYALGLAAKRVAPRTSLGTLFIAPTLADLLWPFFLLLGWEHSHVVPGPNPFLTLWLDDIRYSHSLLTLIVWGAIYGYLYWRRRGDKRAAIVIGLLVVSHWLLDFVTHRPDMPLYPGSPTIGLGMWNSPTATMIVESLMLLVGIAIYTRQTRARDAIGRWGFWALIALLAVSYVVSSFSPTPTTQTALAIGGIIFGWVFVLFGWWVDRHREGMPARIPML
ncbi:MAG TPA: metal-dependent hydrolase [Gemmatimonadales bacterium]|nr:metal-dependent hydrolase [Gemmatimonadales bacterium]